MELYQKLIDYKRDRANETTAFDRSVPFVQQQSELLLIRIQEKILSGMNNLIEVEESTSTAIVRVGVQSFKYSIKGLVLSMAGKRFSIVPAVQCSKNWDFTLRYSLEGPNLKGWVISGAWEDWQIAQHGRDPLVLNSDNFAAVLMKGLL